MRIAFLMGGLMGNGGIGRVVSIITNQLCSHHDIMIISYSPYSKESSLYSINEKINVESLNTITSVKRFIFKGGIKKIRNILEKNNIDILIACGALFFPLTVFACLGTKTKSLCWEHSNANNRSDHQFQMLSRRIGAKRADAVIVLTKQDQEIYRKKFNPHRLFQIYNPIDDRIKYQYSLKANNSIISVGRLIYQKNYPLLIRVADRVLKENPGWTWDIYGDGPDYESIKKQIVELGMNNRICLKGQVEDLYDRYKDYSFYVLTSRYEGFGMAMVEANRTGLPIISFDVECGPREIIENGFNGYLVQPLNEDEMYNKINELCKDRNKCIALSENIKNSENPFKINEIIEKWDLLFKQLA